MIAPSRHCRRHCYSATVAVAVDVIASSTIRDNPLAPPAFAWPGPLQAGTDRDPVA
ncbi:MAG: hypothetical protein QNJ11_19985 [Woeseiaceae bacterium]|nr:hypothetical protein [Woeseiaceae bacterium]